MHRVAKILSHPTCTFPAGVKQDDTLPFCFNFCNVNKCPFHKLFVTCFFFFFLYFCAVICLIEKIPVFGGLCAGMSYSAIGHEFIGNESICK